MNHATATSLLPREALLPSPEADPSRVKAIMEKVRRIELRIRRLVEDSLAGGYQSAFRGRGIDFDQVREYVPGDEVRTIDWNVTARAGRPFIKQFREERELTMMLLVAVSASGDFGSTVRKCELAAELACVLALSATRNNDQVGLILFSDRIERFVPPAKGRSHALRVVREILGCQPTGHGTDLALPLRLAGTMCRRRSLMFLISDLEVGADRTRALAELQRAARPVGLGHDAIALAITDPRERALPDVGLVALEDAETGDVITIDTGRRKVRDRFTALARERARETALVLRRAAFETVDIDTSRPYVPTLLGFFAGRDRRPR